MHKDVIASLAIESVGVEKRAGFWDGLLRGGAKVGAKVTGTAAKIAPKVSTVASHIPSAPTANAALGAATAATAKAAPAAAAAAAPRSFMSRLGRTTAAVGAAGAGAVGVGHANNYLQNEYQERGIKLPFMDRRGGRDPFASYRDHADKLTAYEQPLLQQIADASAAHDHARVGELMRQRESGDFGASKWSFGGLNPFVDAGAAPHVAEMTRRKTEASNQSTAATNDDLSKQRGTNSQIEAVQNRLKQPGLLPQQRAFYQSTLDNLQASLGSLGTESADAARIKTQAQQAGMINPGEQFPSASPAQLGAASVSPPTAPSPAPAPAPAPASPPGANPLLVGGASGAPMSSSSFSVAPRW